MKKILLAGSIFCLVLGQNSISLAAESSPPTQTEKCPKSLPEVIILDYGTEPRQQLRFTPVVGKKQTIKLKMMVGTNTLEDTQVSATKNIRMIEIKVDTTVKKIDTNEDIHLSYLYSGISSLSQNSNDTEQDTSSNLTQFIGSGATLIIDPQGNVKETYDYVFPKNVSSEMKQLIMNESLNYFNQFYPPLPTEAVGVGAKWKINQMIPIMFILSRPNQAIIYELKEKKDNLINLGIFLEQQVDIQESKSSSNGSPTSNQVTTTTTQGEGQATIDLSQMLPINSNATFESKTTMKMTNLETNTEDSFNYNWLFNLSIQSQ